MVGYKEGMDVKILRGEEELGVFAMEEIGVLLKKGELLIDDCAVFKGFRDPVPLGKLVHRAKPEDIEKTRMIPIDRPLDPAG